MTTHAPETELLLTPAEVAALFRVDPKTVTRWAKAGKLTSIRTLGGHRRYRSAEVHALLDANTPARRLRRHRRQSEASALTIRDPSVTPTSVRALRLIHAGSSRTAPTIPRTRPWVTPSTARSSSPPAPLSPASACDFDIVGAREHAEAGGAVLAINHTSYLDFMLGGIPAHYAGHRLVRFMAKDGIFRHPVAGPLMRGMKHIPVDRDAGSAAFRDAVAALKAGELVGVFPEATMSRSFEIKEIKNGAVRMARAADVPLIPMIIFGGQRILSYGVKDFSRGRTVCITVGEPRGHPAREPIPTR